MRPLFRYYSIAVLIAFCPAMHGGTLAIDLAPPVQSGSPGDLLIFQGSLTNTSGSDLFVNGATVSLDAFGPDDIDLTDFVFNATGLLSDGSSIGLTDLFTVSIPVDFAIGQYAGIITVQGGDNDSADAVLGTAVLQVNVDTVPEANSGLLSVVGCSLLVLRTMRKRQTARRSC